MNKITCLTLILFLTVSLATSADYYTFHTNKGEVISTLHITKDKTEETKKETKAKNKGGGGSAIIIVAAIMAYTFFNNDKNALNVKGKSHKFVFNVNNRNRDIVRTAITLKFKF